MSERGWSGGSTGVSVVNVERKHHQHAGRTPNVAIHALQIR